MIFSFFQFRSVLSRVQLIRRALARCFLVIVIKSKRCASRVQLIRRALARCFLVIVIKSKRCAVFRHYGIGFLRHGRNRDCTKK